MKGLLQMSCYRAPLSGAIGASLVVNWTLRGAPTESVASLRDSAAMDENERAAAIAVWARLSA
jgi:hypothetical protein